MRQREGEREKARESKRGARERGRDCTPRTTLTCEHITQYKQSRKAINIAKFEEPDYEIPGIQYKEC